MTSLFDRNQFPMLQQKVHGKPLIYLDSAATALKPLAVIEATSRYYAQEYGTVHRAIYAMAAHATENYSAVREQVARFIKAPSADQIIFTKGTTEAINLVAYSFGKAFIQPGDEVIITEMEHHANIVPWQQMCEERGAHLRIAPIDEEGNLQIDALAKLLNSRTKLVAVAHMSNVLGTINPIPLITEMAHAVGAKVLVDGAQAAAHMPIEVGDVDFYAFSGHKLFGPTGIGILYGKKELLEALPPYQTGGDMILAVSWEKTTFQAPPLKFEAGTPGIAAVMGLGAALSFVEAVGMEAIENHGKELLDIATEKLQAIPGVRIIGTAAHKGPIITFTIDGIHPLDAAAFLDLKGIAIRSGHLCAQPLLRKFGLTAAMRLSLAPYNTASDITAFIEALDHLTLQLK
ncbi:MAG: SufS family cysteine desulfurase [Verrucomicrobia bacterium]|nr:SufS family cysteine desulfurase [Verrucomicrobiota bacterium]